MAALTRSPTSAANQGRSGIDSACPGTSGSFNTIRYTATQPRYAAVPHATRPCQPPHAVRQRDSRGQRGEPRASQRQEPEPVQRGAESEQGAARLQARRSLLQTANDQRECRSVQRQVAQLAVAEIQERRRRQQHETQIPEHDCRPSLDLRHRQRREDEPRRRTVHQRPHRALRRRICPAEQRVEPPEDGVGQVRLGADLAHAAERLERRAAPRVGVRVAHADRLSQGKRIRRKGHAEQRCGCDEPAAAGVGHRRGPEQRAGQREQQQTLHLHELQRRWPDEEARAFHANVNLAARHRQCGPIDIGRVGDGPVADQRANVLTRSVAQLVAPGLSSTGSPANRP